MFPSGNRVIRVAFVKRMTAQNALDGKPTALYDTVFVDGFICISRASRGKPTAGGSCGRDVAPIEANQAKKQAFHDSDTKMPAFSARDR